MDQATREKKIQRILAEQLCVTGNLCTMQAKLEDDLGADSLDVVECVIAIEKEFKINIPDDRGAKIVTVQDVVDTVANLQIQYGGYTTACALK